MGPYREASAAETFEALTREGKARLEVAPRHVVLEIGDRTSLVVSDRFITVTSGGRRGRRKKQSLALDAADNRRLIVARAVPTDDVGIWYERKPGVVMRLLGLRPVELLGGRARAGARPGIDAGPGPEAEPRADSDARAGINAESAALGEWRAFERLSRRLSETMAPHNHGVKRALEIGRGADRVLILEFGDRMVLYVRRLFREHPRSALEVRADGSIIFLDRAGTLASWFPWARRDSGSIQCSSRFGVTTIGDYIRFAAPSGEDLGSLALPWISPEDRHELGRLIGRRIDVEVV